MQQITFEEYRGIDLKPSVPIPDSKRSHLFQPEDLGVGVAVFYRGERYYIETGSSDWGEHPYIRISSVKVHPGIPATDDRYSFYVHPDKLTLAPVGKHAYSKVPTQKAVIVKAERKALGVTDAGDKVAELLRGLDLDAVYKATALYLSENEQELRDRYGHLNHGMQRMNCGNRLRGYIKKNGG